MIIPAFSLFKIALAHYFVTAIEGAYQGAVIFHKLLLGNEIWISNS